MIVLNWRINFNFRAFTCLPMSPLIPFKNLKAWTTMLLSSLRQSLHNDFFISCFLSDILFCHGCSNSSSSSSNNNNNKNNNNNNSNNNSNNNNNNRNFEIAYWGLFALSIFHFVNTPYPSSRNLIVSLFTDFNSILSAKFVVTGSSSYCS